MSPSMLEAAKIRDVAARHAYVFDNGLCSPDFFDVEKRMASEEFGLLRERITSRQTVLEIGCFTGLNLLGLAQCGHEKLLDGVEFVPQTVEWLKRQPNAELIRIAVAEFPRGFGPTYYWDRIICFDVLEHQRNVGEFLDSIPRLMNGTDSRALFLVPVGTNYNDCGHVAWFPDVECLRNVLDYVLEVEEIFELKTCRKMFASCRRR